ncbi:MAG: SdiA-regulated domain-containing protein [Bacteroidota bacterium]
MPKPLLLGTLTVLVLLGATCASALMPQPPPPYLFDAPALWVELPKDLDEISGLDRVDDRTLVAVQDEDGIVYHLDAETGALLREVEFEDDGDYEGIAHVAGRLFVLRSDGRLYELSDVRADAPKVREHRTPLDDDQDTEGLVYDAQTHRLLIACKEEPGPGAPEPGVRTIHAYSLEIESMAAEPAFVLDRDRLRADGRAFKPSALALHPLTGRLYVLSSVRRALAVLEPDGQLYAVWDLPKSLLAQPEGLAFLSNGDLFVASEADGEKAVLARFAYQPE